MNSIAPRLGLSRVLLALSTSFLAAKPLPRKPDSFVYIYPGMAG
jgi:hypothetical protein